MTFLSEKSPRGVTVISICAIFLALAIVAVILRFWSTKIKKTKLGLSDYTTLVALVLSIVLMGLTVAAVEYGLGQNINEVLAVQPQNLVTFVQLYLALSIVWITAITAVKVSILHLYIGIFRVNWFIKVCWAFMIFNAVVWACVILQTALICRPIALFWNPMLQGVCGNRGAAYLATHIIILILDVAIALLPTPVLWRLQLRTSKKIAVSLLFGLGICICIIALLRIVWYKRAGATDITYEWTLLFLFTVLEPLIGITLSCLPLIKPVFGLISNSHLMTWSRKRLLAYGTSNSSKSGNSSSVVSNRKDFARIRGNPYQTGDEVERLALRDMEAQNLKECGRPGHKDSIHVTKTWNVGASSSQEEF